MNMKFGYCILCLVFGCGCQQDNRFAELDVRRPFGFEVGGSADEAIKRGGWEFRATLQGGEPAGGLAGAGGEFTMVTGLRFRYVGLDWQNRLFTRIEASAAEGTTEDVARSAYKRLCEVVKKKFGRRPDECNKNQPLYGGVVLEEQVWKENRCGHTFIYKVKLDLYRSYWGASYTAEDVDLAKEVFRREAQSCDLPTSPWKFRSPDTKRKPVRGTTNEVQEVEVGI